jgi:uncharacterized protein (DUF934 family)
MPDFIKDNVPVTADPWVWRDEAEQAEPGSIVPLAAFLASDPVGSGYGAWLAGDAEPETLRGRLAPLALIAVRFANHADGRGYSIARLLRERLGYAGELRAVGDIRRDQMHYLARVGFNAFALAEGEDVAGCIAALRDFSESYQTSVDRPQPLFRRRGAEASGLLQ